MTKIKIDLDELVRKMRVQRMRQMTSDLEQNSELVREMWIDAFKKSPEPTRECTNAERNAKHDTQSFTETLRALENGEELVQQFIGCLSSVDDERLAFASQMFTKGLVYGSLYLEDVMKSRNQAQLA